MASENRTHLTPARNFASRVSRRLGLAPPVAILELLEQHADVEHDDIPGTCDALLITRVGKRPLVILDEQHHGGERERFSAAHELGHILMPWQHGTVFCDTGRDAALRGDVIRDIERDANQFASELLLPGPWLRNQLLTSRDDLAEGLLGAMRTAQVSVPVAVIAASRCLAGPGFVASTRPFGEVEHVAAIEADGHFRSRAPVSGSLLEPEKYRRMGAEVHEAAFGSRTLWIVRHVGSEVKVAAPARSSAEIRTVMLAKYDEATALRLTRVIGGIGGAAYGLLKRSSEPTVVAVYNALRTRFVDVDELRDVIRHPDFDEFLRARAHELARPRR